MYREEEIDHKIKERIHNTTQKDITSQEAYIELSIEDQLDNQLDNPKRINYLNLIWLREKMYKEAIEETRKNVLKEAIEETRKNVTMIKLGFTCKICKERKEKTLLNLEELTDNIITSICYECMDSLKGKPQDWTKK